MQHNLYVQSFSPEFGLCKLYFFFATLLHTEHSTIQGPDYTLTTANYIIHNKHSTQQFSYCTMHTAICILRTAYCTLCEWIQWSSGCSSSLQLPGSDRWLPQQDSSHCCKSTTITATQQTWKLQQTVLKSMKQLTFFQRERIWMFSNSGKPL